MRFMILVKASPDSEAGKMPSQDMLTAMGTFNEELANAGVLLAGEGLHPSSRGKRVTFSGDARTVIDGPFGETKDLIAGFWLWQCQSMDEALDWAKRVPFHASSARGALARPSGTAGTRGGLKPIPLRR